MLGWWLGRGEEAELRLKLHLDDAATASFRLQQKLHNLKSFHRFIESRFLVSLVYLVVKKISELVNFMKMG